MIAGWCWKESWYHREDDPTHVLKRLRTVSRGFTQLPSINKRLFSTLIMTA